MSDTEQHKKRKLEEVAEAAAATSEIPATTDAAPTTATSADSSTSTTTTTTTNNSADSNSVLSLQLAEEKQRIVKLLEPFSREQLIAILASAASQYSNILNEIKAVASTDIAHRKIFVRGLAWEVTSETLQDTFSTFGAVEEAAVIYDKATNKSKGYGFVTFVDMDAAQRAVEQQTIDINGRRATCNLAAMRANADEHHQSGGSSHGHHHHAHHQQPSHRSAAAPQQQLYSAPAAAPQQQMYAPAPASTSGSSGYSDESERKLFVRGLSWNTTDDMFYAEFVKYGDLDEAMIARDRATGKSKGFGFITFKHKASADLALQQPQKIIDGRTTTCNLASQGGSRAGGGSGGSMGGGYANMTPVMPAPVPTYAMPMYAAMPGQYAPQQMPQAAPMQYGAYPAMADPYHAQGYGAPAPQYYQNRPPPGQQPPAQR